MVRVVIIFLFTIQCFAQDTESGKNFYIKTAPFGVIDFYNGPQLNVSFENPFFSRSGLNSEIGFHFPFLDFISDWENIKGFVWKEEFRTYFSNDEKNSAYWAIESSVGYQKYGRTDLVDIYPLVPDSILTYTAERKYAGITFNIGQKTSFKSGLMIEYFFGLGLRLNQVKTSLSEFDNERRYFGDWTVPNNWIQRDGLNVIPKFNFGIRIGFCVRD